MTRDYKVLVVMVVLVVVVVVMVVLVVVVDLWDHKKNTKVYVSSSFRKCLYKSVYGSGSAACDAVSLA